MKKEIEEDVELIKGYTPSPTKIEKKHLRRKEVTKTDEELQTEKMILFAQKIISQENEILAKANKQAGLVISGAEETARKIISKAENSEIVLKAKSEAKKIIQEAEITRSCADDYYKERIALADEESEERSRQLDEREAHITALAELSKPTAEYEERMAWLYDMPVRHMGEELSEEVDEPEELDFDEVEIEEPDNYYDYEF